MSRVGDMATDDEVVGRLAASRQAWQRLVAPGGVLAGLPESPDALDEAVRRLEGVWAGEDAPLGTEPAPPWSAARMMQVLVGSLPAGALPVLDALAVQAGDLEVIGARSAGARWVSGTGRDAGLLVVTDDARGITHEPLRAVFGSVQRIRSGEDPRALSRLVRDLVETRLRSEREWARQSLESFSPWETYILRRPPRGLLRRRPGLGAQEALEVLQALTDEATEALGGEPSRALEDQLHVIDPGVGWWRAVLTLGGAGGADDVPARGDSVDEVRVTVIGSPEDAARGSDPGDLGNLLRRVRRVADERGLEVERALGPGRSWDDQPLPVS